MHDRKRNIFALLIAVPALLLGLLPITAAPASAANATPGCVTKAEWRKISKDKSLARVRRVVGARGRITSTSDFSDGDGWRSVKFRQCGRSWARSYAQVHFEKTETEVWISDIYCYDWDGDGIEEDCEDYGYYETQYSLPFVVTSKSAYWG